MTDGRGADACIDAVGMEAEHGFRETFSNVLHLQVGTSKVLRAAVAAARRGGAVSVIGMYEAHSGDFPLNEVLEKGLRLRGGLAPVHACIDKLMDLVAAGRLSAEDLVTHRLPLQEGPDAYRVFNNKSDDCLKIVLKPWAEEVREEEEKESSVESDELDSEPAPGMVMPPSLF